MRLLPLFLLLLAAPARADIFVEHLDPPALHVGKATRLTVHGSDLKNAVCLWTTLPNNETLFSATLVSAADTSAIFDVTLKPEAAVGLHGLRVVTRDGLSNVQLFLVDDLNPVARELGENPQALKWPVAVHGTFREAATDRYTVDVTAGQSLSLEVVGNRFGKDADPLLTIRDADGKFLAEHDNSGGLYFDCRLSHRFEKAGRYTLELRDSRFRGNLHQPYVLRVGTFPADYVRMSESPTVLAPAYDHLRGAGQHVAASPEMIFAFQMSPMKLNPFASLDRLIPTGTLQASKVTVPCVVGGVLRQPKEHQAVWFELAKGQAIYVRADGKTLNSPVDVDFVIVDKNGREVRRPENNREPLAADFTAGNPGVYGVVVRDVLNGGGPAHAYQLTISDEPFPPAILAEVEGVTVPQGTWQPVPITVTRTGGGDLKLKLLNAPAGMTLSPDVIPAGKTAVLCKLSASSATPVGMNTLRIVATEELPSKKTREVLVRTQPLIDRQLHNVDLIPIGLREDQKRLPPGVTDRLAVQVTPPSPFDFDPAAEVTLPRYQTADIPITIRGNGALTFTAKGGQLGPKTEGRTRVYAEFPTSKPGETTITGHARSLILSNAAKSRIDVTATGTVNGRRIQLTRPFELNLTTAFSLVSDETAKPVIQPGESVTLTLKCDRLKSFSGAVTVHFNPNPNFDLSETATFPAGQTTMAVKVTAKPDAGNGRHQIGFHATAQVDGYEEEVRGLLGEVEVKKIEPPKKK